jgi:hypothetical protein
MTIRGVSHITFIVRDVHCTSELFRLALGDSEVYDAKSCGPHRRDYS